MGSHPIFKSVDEYTINSFKAYKLWTLTESTIMSYSSSVNEAIYVSESVVIDNTGTNASGFGKSGLFSTVYNMYYRYPTLPYNALGGNAQFQDRDISGSAVVVSIGKKYIGERIKPGSISITSGSIVVKDDGLGNLYNSTDTTTYVSTESLMGHWSFNEGFVTNGNLASDFENRNHVLNQPAAQCYNVTYTPGVYGSRINFDGTSGSFGRIKNYREINFRTAGATMIQSSTQNSVSEDFAVSVWVWIPPSQSMASVPDNMIVEKWDCEGGYPFVIRMFNQTYVVPADRGKVYCATWDTQNGAGLTSTNALNDNLPHHIVYQRTGNTYELYVDGVSNGSMSINLLQTHNNSDLYIGARGYAPAVSGTIYNFTGGIDELRVYSGSLTSGQIATLYVSASNTNVVGNAYYAHGVLTLTNLTPFNTQRFMLAGSEFSMTYKSTVTITENSILATVAPSEFNMTLNPSSADVYDVDSMPYMSIVTGSDWSPYITTLGLYDDNLNLLAVAKFARPIKKPTDIPMTFAIRWDS